jgi:hypothetical protein
MRLAAAGLPVREYHAYLSVECFAHLQSQMDTKGTENAASNGGGGYRL